VTYKFRAEVTTEDGKERLTVTTTYPIAVEELKEGQAVPPRDPNIVIPGMEKTGGG